ncbi:MAG: TetR/AcrR family transcriptional regulator [Gemmatimonadota bacterium]
MQLVEAAKELFHLRGYTAVGVNDICRQAGVQKGSLYHFFDTKRDLALAAVEAHWDSYRLELLEPAFAEDVPPFDRIRRLFRMVRTYQESGRDENGQIRGCPFANLALEMSTLDPLLRRRLEEIFDGIATYFAATLREAYGRREAREAKIQHKARELVAYHQGVVLLAKARNQARLIDDLAEGAVQLATAA